MEYSCEVWLKFALWFTSCDLKQIVELIALCGKVS